MEASLHAHDLLGTISDRLFFSTPHGDLVAAELFDSPPGSQEEWLRGCPQPWDYLGVRVFYCILVKAAMIAGQVACLLKPFLSLKAS